MLVTGEHDGPPPPGPPAGIRCAVIVPVWRQPQFLAGAVMSALEQGDDIAVVIVNDGCPFESTDRIASTLRDAHPHRVAYVRQPDRGLPSARNAGIRCARERWPQIEAVFPLDADNELSPGTLGRLWAALDADPGAAWASPTLELFGAETGECVIPGPCLAYRQLFFNQSDAGSLIRCTVFDAGIGFAEGMIDGYEDWELFLHATPAGVPRRAGRPVRLPVPAAVPLDGDRGAPAGG